MAAEGLLPVYLHPCVLWKEKSKKSGAGPQRERTSLYMGKHINLHVVCAIFIVPKKRAPEVCYADSTSNLFFN